MNQSSELGGSSSIQNRNELEDDEQVLFEENSNDEYNTVERSGVQNIGYQDNAKQVS